MKFVFIAIALGFSIAASAVGISNKALIITAPNDTFSRCIANAAVTKLASTSPYYAGFVFQHLVSSGVEGFGQIYLDADLNFVAANVSSNSMLKLVLRSTDTTKGWQLVQGSTGEIYPHATSIDSSATVIERSTGHVIVHLDISSCQ